MKNSRYGTALAPLEREGHWRRAVAADARCSLVPSTSCARSPAASVHCTTETHIAGTGPGAAQCPGYAPAQPDRSDSTLSDSSRGANLEKSPHISLFRRRRGCCSSKMLSRAAASDAMICCAYHRRPYGTCAPVPAHSWQASCPTKALSCVRVLRVPCHDRLATGDFSSFARKPPPQRSD
jgi:hypothetical protein